VALADAPEASRHAELIAGVIPFLLVATGFGLAKLGRPTIERIAVPPRVVAALLAAILVFFVAFSESSPYFHPWDWGGRDETDEARLKAIALVHESAPVAATPHLLVPLARRVSVYLYVPGAAVPADVDLVLTDAADGVVAGREPTPEGFALIVDDHGIGLYRRIFVPSVVVRN
jgi:hypothetical protein